MFSLIFLLVLSVGFSEGGFDSRVPKVARGIIGQTLKVPCSIENFNPQRHSKISWQFTLGVDPYRSRSMAWNESSTDTRISVVRETAITGNPTWTLTFAPLQASDAGYYSCGYLSSNQEEEDSTDYFVAPFESNEGLTWDRSLRCGADHEVGGKAAECDADGTYPCCSPNGWCGYTQNHCDCDGCVDYRRIPAPNDKRPVFDDKYPANYTVHVGQQVSFTCSSLYPFKTFLAWEKKGISVNEVLYENESPTSKHSRAMFFRTDRGLTRQMTLSFVTQCDGGTYICKFIDDFQTYDKEFHLTVQD